MRNNPSVIGQSLKVEINKIEQGFKTDYKFEVFLQDKNGNRLTQTGGASSTLEPLSVVFGLIDISDVRSSCPFIADAPISRLTNDTKYSFFETLVEDKIFDKFDLIIALKPYLSKKRLKILTINLPSNILTLLELYGLLPYIENKVTDQNLLISFDRPTYCFYDMHILESLRGHMNLSAEYFRAKVLDVLSQQHKDEVRKMTEQKLLLVGGLNSRVSNRTELYDMATAHGWEIANPLKANIKHLLLKLHYAQELISENGSILFNCFLSRHRPYMVLSSSRKIEESELKMTLGGEVYNNFHSHLIKYTNSKDYIASPKHPYADTINVLNLQKFFS